jgi:hypothetical protein
MNPLLKTYDLSLDYPTVSGAEQLELLMIRDQLAAIETELNTEEQKILVSADQKLLLNAAMIYQELSHFINLADYRQTHHILPKKWWWYLDVLSCLPTDSSSPSIVA